MKLDSVHPGPQVKRCPGEKVQQCWAIEEAETKARCPKATPRNKQEPLIVAGVAVASSCQIILPVFGALFFIVGTVLTIASYRGPEPDEDAEQYADRVNITSNLRILGPCCLAIGTGMAMAGFALCLLARRAKQQKLAFHCPLHGDFYQITSSQSNILSLSKRSSLAWCGKSESEDDEVASIPTPQCPHSNRSSVSNSTGHNLVSPIGPAQSMNGLLTPNHYPLRSNIGSTQSLAMSYDVASFPHSRSPTPTSEHEGEAKAQEDPPQSEQA